MVFSYMFYFLFLLTKVSCELQIRDSGVREVRPQDVAMIFFITIRNNGDHSFSISTSMEQCCELITDEDQDCDTIDLFGGDMGVLHSGEENNFTLISPTLYEYNRRGSCLVKIQYHREDSFKNNLFRHRIDFDTSYLETEDKDGRLCQTSDLDPFDNCLPVNCLIKYSGFRNYFDRNLKRCQPVPTCTADYTKDTPNIAYNPYNNECVDLENPLTEEEIKKLTENDADEFSENRARLLNVRCHHGHIDRVTGLCRCDPGWKTDFLDTDQYSPSTAVYHMCNVKTHSYMTYIAERPGYVLFALLAGVIPALLLAVCICYCDKYFQATYVKQKCYDSAEVAYFEDE